MLRIKEHSLEVHRWSLPQQSHNLEEVEEARLLPLEGLMEQLALDWEWCYGSESTQRFARVFLQAQLSPEHPLVFPQTEKNYIELVTISINF